MKPSILVALLAILCLAPAAHSTEAAVLTDATLLVGFPLEGESAREGTEGTLVVPGTVIPVQRPRASPLPEKTRLRVADADAARSELTATIGSHLTSTFRLSRVEVAYRHPVSVKLGETATLASPTPGSPVTIEVELLGFNRQSATYQVRFLDGSTVLADSRVSATRGERTVIGGTNGPEAPYLFLVLEPQTMSARPLQVTEDSGIRPPLAQVKVPPQYTEEAKQEGTTGVVIIQTVINTAGRIEDARVLKGLPHGLSEKALEAIRQWEFEPARDAQGNPVAVYYNLTINFTLG